jgi:hypothetical protein
MLRPVVTLVLVLGLVAVTACEDDGGPPNAASAGAAGQAGSPQQGGQAGVTSCLERPGDLQRPPRRGLPCELLPPRHSP